MLYRIFTEDLNPSEAFLASTSGQGETTIVRNGRSEETTKQAWHIRNTL